MGQNIMHQPCRSPHIDYSEASFVTSSSALYPAGQYQYPQLTAYGPLTVEGHFLISHAQALHSVARAGRWSPSPFFPCGHLRPEDKFEQEDTFVSSPLHECNRSCRVFPVKIRFSPRGCHARTRLSMIITSRSPYTMSSASNNIRGLY